MIVPSRAEDIAKLHSICKYMGVNLYPGRTEYGVGIYLFSDEICYDNSDISFNATNILLHEICHATGAQHRLKRPAFIDRICTVNNNIEEIIAIYSSIQLSEDLGLSRCLTTEQHVMSFIDKHYHVNEEHYDVEFIAKSVDQCRAYLLDVYELTSQKDAA